jgi:hypothetical protein
MKKDADRYIVAAKIAEIESEMMRVGVWQPEPLQIDRDPEPNRILGN